jgi:hypothetical protein
MDSASDFSPLRPDPELSSEDDADAASEMSDSEPYQSCHYPSDTEPEEDEDENSSTDDEEIEFWEHIYWDGFDSGYESDSDNVFSI